MNITQQANGVLLSDIKHFDIKKSCECGQCFRFNKSVSGYIGVIGQNIADIRILPGEGYLFADTDMESFMRVFYPYFDLGRDYDKIVSAFENDTILCKAAQFGNGIRIFRQDAWETLISFIISQNNNIPRIKGIIKRLCESFGEQIQDDFYAFPSAQRLAALSTEALAPIRAGFRARYIIDAAKKTACGKLAIYELCALPYENAQKELLTVTGVGKKVADCVLLFGAGHTEAFPVDVWIKRALAVLYPDLDEPDFGLYGGLAQQYLFYYAREKHLIKL